MGRPDGERVAPTETKCSIVMCVRERSTGIMRYATTGELPLGYYIRVTGFRSVERPRELTASDEVCPEIRLYRQRHGVVASRPRGHRALSIFPLAANVLSDYKETGPEKNV